MKIALLSNHIKQKTEKEILETQEVVVLDLAMLAGISDSAPVLSGEIIIVPEPVCPSDPTNSSSR